MYLTHLENENSTGVYTFTTTPVYIIIDPPTGSGTTNITTGSHPSAVGNFHLLATPNLGNGFMKWTINGTTKHHH